MLKIPWSLRLEQQARGERSQVVPNDGEQAPGHVLVRRRCLLRLSPHTLAPLLDLESEAGIGAHGQDGFMNF